VLDVGLVVADDAVGHLVATRGILEVDGCAEHHAAIGVDRRRIDHLRVGELGFDFGDAALDEALPLLRGIVVGILREITMRARFRDRLDDRRSLDRSQPVQFHLETLGALDSHRYFCHDQLISNS